MPFSFKPLLFPRKPIKRFNVEAEKKIPQFFEEVNESVKSWAVEKTRENERRRYEVLQDIVRQELYDERTRDQLKEILDHVDKTGEWSADGVEILKILQFDAEDIPKIQRGK